MRVKNLTVSAKRSHGKDLMVTMDLRQGRLNFTIDDGVVTAVEEEAPKAD